MKKMDTLTTITDHHSDIADHLLKTDIEVVQTPEGNILRKRYLPGKERFFGAEFDFNRTVEATGFSKKPKIIAVNEEEREISMEYFSGINLEVALTQSKTINFDKLISLMLEETFYLRKATPEEISHLREISSQVTSNLTRKYNGSLINRDYFASVRGLLTTSDRLVSPQRKEQIETMLTKAEVDPVLLRFDPEMSNFLSCEDGEIRPVDYSIPWVAHPIHNVLYFLSHLDLPRKKTFYNMRNNATNRLYSVVRNRLKEFFNGTQDVESTIKCAYLDLFAANFIFDGAPEISPDQKMNPSYQDRVNAIIQIVDLSVDELLQAKMEFRRQ
ncbi:hypothetical protein CEE44_03790 [Candidatus Woesearchaeota archaeon B3_Woes]|nr:MAG: hypothetical protein CEE44_03790 [Candidatus Woesearchaeota archaeon B3_Woes]